MRSAEQLAVDESQMLLFLSEAEEPEAEQDEQESEKTEVKSHTRKKPGRKALDPNLPRIERVIAIPEEEKICACGALLTRIGEEVNEKLHIIEPRLFVKQVIRPKYACCHCEGTESEGITPTVRVAPVEPSIIPRSIASPSLLSHVLTAKFEHHMPYYRQEKQFEQIGAQISR